MIYITFKKPDKKNLVWSSSKLFNLVYKKEWFQDPFVIEMIREIDKTEYFDDNLFKSPVLGYIRAEELSGGVKTLILALKYKNPDKLYYRLSSIGDNCYPLLDQFQDKVNVYFYGNCNPRMKHTRLRFYIEDSGKIVDNIIDYIDERYRIGREETF